MPPGGRQAVSVVLSERSFSNFLIKKSVSYKYKWTPEMTYLMGKGQAFGREIEAQAGIDFAYKSHGSKRSLK